MSDAPSLVLLTAIEPNSQNLGGPSGLPWEILEELVRGGWKVSIQHVPLATGRLNRRLMQLAVPQAAIKVEQTDADVYIAYPFYLGRLIPSELRSRTILLGPDATSMLYARFARIESGWRRWRALLLSRWFALHEKWVAHNLAGMVVVGRNDARWLKHVIGTNFHDRVFYIPHPVLRMVALSTPVNGDQRRPRVVFAGDLSRKYIGDFFDTLDYVAVATALSSVDCEILVVGKNNRTVYDTIATRLPAQYEEWVEDYSTLCDPLRDIHAIPLMAGAGTKNRTLTALAMNVIVLSTPIGIENIDIEVLRESTVHRFRSSLEFASALDASLRDLRSRRLSRTFNSHAPIERIADTFREATLRVMQAVAISNAPSSQKHDQGRHHDRGSEHVEVSTQPIADREYP